MGADGGTEGSATDAGDATAAGPIGALVSAASDSELPRRLVHASGAVSPLSYLAGLPYTWLRALLVVGVLVAAILELLRLEVGLDWRIYDRLTREYEQHKVAGYALYLVSMAAVAVAVRPVIAVPAMLMLAVADPVGGALGGADPTPVKRPLALAGTFLVCLAVAWPFLGVRSPAAAVTAAAAATVADGVFLEVRGHVIDDNLGIPLAAAVVAWVALAFLPA